MAESANEFLFQITHRLNNTVADSLLLFVIFITNFNQKAAICAKCRFFFAKSKKLNHLQTVYSMVNRYRSI